MIENINEIQEYLEANKDNGEVIDFMKSIQQPLTRDVIETWCQDGEGRSWLDRNCDIYSQKAVKTARENAIAKFKEEELPKILETEIKKSKNEGKSPLEIKVEELEKQNADILKQVQMKDLESKYKDTLNEKGLDTRLMKYILSDNPEDIENNINLFSEIINNTTENKVKEKLNNSSYVPPKSDAVVNTMTKEKFLQLGFSEQNKFATENPEQYKEIMK